MQVYRTLDIGTAKPDLVTRYLTRALGRPPINRGGVEVKSPEVVNASADALSGAPPGPGGAAKGLVGADDAGRHRGRAASADEQATPVAVAAVAAGGAGAALRRVRQDSAAAE